MTTRDQTNGAASLPSDVRGDPPIEGIQMVTPEQAAYWLVSCKYDRQRDLRPYHAQNLADEIKAGRFRKKTAVNFCLLRGQHLLVNGQHTLTAIFAAKQPELLSVIVTECSSDEEVADEFSRHDTHLTRQVSDALFAHRMDEELGVSPTTLRRITAAGTYYAFMIGELGTSTATRLSNDRKLEIVRRHGPAIRDAMVGTGVQMGKHDTKWTNRKAVLASIALTYIHRPEMAIEFWSEAFADDGLRATDPRKALIKRLESATAPGSAWTVRSASSVLHDHHIVKLCAVAWNAFYDRRELKLLRFEHDAREVDFTGCQKVRV